MAEEAQVVERTETQTVRVEEESGNEGDHIITPEVASVAAAQGAVAVAAEAIALNETVTAKANIAAADTVRRSVDDFERAFGELATWQGATVERLQVTEARQAEQEVAISSIQNSLTELLTKLSQNPTTASEAEQVPVPTSPESAVESDAPPRRRHRFL